MPNFFVEAVTVADGRVYTEIREIIVPPEKRVLKRRGRSRFGRRRTSRARRPR